MMSGLDEFGREILIPNRQRDSSPPASYEHEEIRHISKGSRRQEESRRSPVPSVPYVHEPMLCQYIWKSRREKQVGVEDHMLNDEDKAELLGSSDDTYDDYRQAYCLAYIQAFFNQHMDDSWFRNRYSPLARKRCVVQHMERAAMEAQRISRDFISAPVQFVEQARLGSGTNRDSSVGSKRKLSDSDKQYNAVPISHVFSISDRVVKLTNIPPKVSEKQIMLALLRCSDRNAQIRIFSGSVNGNETPKPLHRDAFCVFENADVKREILLKIQKASVESTDHVPRKDDHKVLQLNVDCTDPYDRVDIEEESGGQLPRQIVPISMSDEVVSQKVVVLSAMLSSKSRISKDKESAIELARMLDSKHKVPREFALDTLLEPVKLEDEDILDVAIAYLRRVHLFSFYNGCVFTDNFADVLVGNHPSSTIHLRLKDADTFLKNNRQEVDNADTTCDLLVKRLDESIRKAKENCKSWVNHDCIISPEVDADAAEIEALEKETERLWVQNHGIMDKDNRARCGFLFCRKLFKDMSFLVKHLYKKHLPYLHAEVAKCHDSYMMRAWDTEEIRPVPPIHVDCGDVFGLAASRVIGAASPIAEDPEPILWQKKEECLKREEERHQIRHRRENDVEVSPAAAARRSTFVDVDDMKEEKVTLSFESVEVPVQLTRKKKKKKLL
jgi:SERRATE/Ars2, N-terminal domain